MFMVYLNNFNKQILNKQNSFLIKIINKYQKNKKNMNYNLFKKQREQNTHLKKQE